jgi:DNA-binding FadR family transcriptional regulator
LPLEAIEPRRLYRQIADQLRQLIDSGEYAVGARLPAERELADTLGVSRPTVREALISLEVEGRLSIRVGSGIYVTAPQPGVSHAPNQPIDGPFEVLGARDFIESAIAEEAARKATDEDIARIDEILAEVAASQLPRKEWTTLDRRFHVAIASTLQNAVLTRIVGELFDQRVNPYFERLARHIECDATMRAADREHTAIRNAIASRVPAKARVAMHEHMKGSHQRFARDFGEEPPTNNGSRGRRSRLSATA